MKNVYSVFFKIFTFSLLDILAPITAPIIPDNIIIIDNFKLIIFFFKFIIIDEIEVGIKNIKFVACALC